MPTSPSWTFLSRSENDTDRLGRALADALSPGTTVALIGNLGAGKTRLVQAVAKAAGVERQQVNSPTYILVQEYEGRWPIYHFDTYRLGDSSEFLELGAEEYMACAGVCFIEWADRVAEVLPPDHLVVTIRILDDTTRRYDFHPTGNRSRAIITHLQQTLS